MGRISEAMNTYSRIEVTRVKEARSPVPIPVPGAVPDTDADSVARAD